MNPYLYQIQSNLWIGFIIRGKCGYIELAGYKQDKKVDSIFPMDNYTIEEAIEEFQKYLNK